MPFTLPHDDQESVASHDTLLRRPSVGFKQSLTPPVRVPSKESTENNTQKRIPSHNDETVQTVASSTTSFSTAETVLHRNNSKGDREVLMEGVLNLNNNKWNTRYFVLLEDGTVHVTKNQQERLASKIGTRLVVTRIEKGRRRLGSRQHILVLHFASGKSKQYSTSSQEEQEQWIQASNGIITTE